MKKLVFIALIFLLNCTNTEENFFKKIKNLEYSRSSVSEKWDELYQSAEKNKKLEILNSVAKTRNDSLFDWLKIVYAKENDPEIRSAIIFSFGQLKSTTAEDYLINQFDNSNRFLKHQILKAVEENGTTKSSNIILSAFKDDSLINQALVTAAILARKKIPVGIFADQVSDSSWSNHDNLSSAYFVYYAHEYFSNFQIAQFLAKSVIKEARKYYLKAFLKNKLSKENLKADSLLNIIFRKEIESELLTTATDWQNKLYALDLIRVYADSAEKNIISRFIDSSNPHLKRKALSVFSDVYKNEALSTLINLLEKETDLYLKGEIIKDITRIDERRGYRYIMQNIDRGNTVFKERLLEALSTIREPLAFQQLKNFLKVKDTKLVLKSLNLLAKNKRLSQKDVVPLISNQRMSVSSTALQWLYEKKYDISINELLKLYTENNKAGFDDLQVQIIEMLKEKSLASHNIDTLIQNTNSARVLKKIKKIFNPNNISEMPKSRPEYLSIDSLANLPEIITAIIETERGAITIELYPEIAPLTVKNFIGLSQDGFYDNNIFHRVIEDFVIQGGDPDQDGWGGPGYSIPSEDNRLSFERGVVGMATSGFDTGGSQFFICHSEQKHLRANYTAFGKVIDGLNVVDKIVVGDKILKIKIL